MARAQFDKIADLLDLSSGARALLRSPMREYHFNIPVRMVDGCVQVFQGFRSQHNDARGPCKGGVICDPHNLSAREQEQICRGWVRQIARDIGPVADVPAPDVMTNAQHMLWMLDEFEIIHGGRYPGMITGKPVGMGGSLGRTQATGYGVIYTLREALKDHDIRPGDTIASVQGFGNVAQYAIELYNQMGGKVICVSCWDQNDQTSYSFVKKDSIDLAELQKITDRFGGIDKAKDAELGDEISVIRLVRPREIQIHG